MPQAIRNSMNVSCMQRIGLHLAPVLLTAQPPDAVELGRRRCSSRYTVDRACFAPLRHADFAIRYVGVMAATRIICRLGCTQIPLCNL